MKPTPTMMEPLKDILVFTPVYRLEPEMVRAALKLEWNNGAVSWLFQEDNPYDNGRKNHLHQFQRGREQFLAGRYDAMLVIESDIIVPADTLIRLAVLDADCGYGVYRFRISNVINIYQRYPPKNGKPPRNMGESLSNHPQELIRAMKVGRWPCSGAGTGCVLIRRNVLEQIDFRMEGESGAHCDTFFNIDVMRAGFSQFADMGLICGHVNELGEVLWPDLPRKTRLK